MVAYVQAKHGLSVRRACQAFGLSRSVYAYKPTPTDDGLLIETLVRLAEQYPRYGFGKLFALVRRQQPTWNHKRIYRVYCALKLNLRRKGKKRLPSRQPQKLAVPVAANVCWSADFMSDVLMSGTRFRTLNVLDDFNREALAIEIDTSLPAARVISVLEQVSAWRGCPARLRLDNGPELVSVALADWAERRGVALEFIQPGKPTQNSFIERFNRTYREEVLDFYIFSSLAEVREITQAWLRQYNEQGPHEALGDLAPSEYLAINSPEVSTFDWH